MDKSENKMNPKKSIKRDFHAKPLELVIQGRDFRYYKVEDVLREREAYEKEIALYKTAMNANAKSAEAAEAELRKLQDTTVPHEEYQAVLGRADRAEAAEKELKEIKTHHDEHYKNWLIERELRVKAEADVKTLLEQNKVLAEAAEKGGTVFVPIYHQLRLKKAEGWVKELESGIQAQTVLLAEAIDKRRWTKAHNVLTDLKALAGEKTKCR